MKALFSLGGDVPLARAMHEHRAWLVPLAIVLLVNAAVLIAVVLPLSRSVSANEEREQAARAAVLQGERDVKVSEALRDGKAQATTDLDVFYREVLPADVSVARRLTHVKLAQLAEKHQVLYERGSTRLEQLRESTLERLHVSMSLTGQYADIRAFLHGLETSTDFVVIDNMVLMQGEDDERKSGLSLTLQISTYYRAPAGSNAR
jgi:Tfp pilus assembly protein PilO